MNDDDLENIDSYWIEEFENLDKEYKDYYTEDLAVINIHCIYVNKNDEIERVLENKLILKTPGIISKEEILGLIKHNMVCNEVKYSLLYILKFNINLEPIYLKTFIRSKEPLVSIGNQFIQSIKNITIFKNNFFYLLIHENQFYEKKKLFMKIATRNTCTPKLFWNKKK